MHFQRIFPCLSTLLNSKRLLALAAQKFLSDVAADAYSHARIRSGGGRSKAGGAAAKVTFGLYPLPQTILTKLKVKTVLTMEDLSAALAEYGVNARKPEYYI